MTNRINRRWLEFASLITLLLAIFGGVVVFSRNQIVLPRGLSFDFYPRYVGSQAFWNGESPYTPEVTARIQTGMWGFELPPAGYDQQRFAYPAYTALVIAPLLLLPVTEAIAIQMALQYFAVLAAVGVWLWLLRWHVPAWLLFFLLIGFGLVFRYPVNLYLVAQFTGIMLLLISLALILLLRQRDVAAGILFALATIPPTIAAPLALIVLGAYALHGRWRGLLAFVGTLALLSLLAVLRIGWWIPDFVAGLSDYSVYSHPIWALGLIEAPVLRVVAGGIVVAALIWAAIRLIPDQPLDFAALAITGTLLLIPQTGNYYLVLLIAPLLVAAERARRLPPLPRYALWIACTAAIVSPWLYWSLPAPTVESLALPLHVGLIWLILLTLGHRHDSPRVA